jgi:hypothetical protein
VTRFWVALGRNVDAGEIVRQVFSVCHGPRRGKRKAFQEDGFIRVEPVLHRCGCCGSEEVT